ncbi:MAG: tetratricopeptide repeat protein [Magnetococcales bacterium]|nr:tetratricopeptide repeat protein [Magnetococcales bacterium]
MNPRRALGVAALVLLPLLLYGRSWGYGYINFDDTLHLQHAAPLHQGLSPESLVWALTNREHAIWTPVTWLSFLLEWSVSGGDPGVSHAINLVLHLANSLLVFGVMQRLLPGFWAAAWVAMAFAVHPLHVEAVVWVIERKEMLAALFGLLALRSWLIAVERAGAMPPRQGLPSLWLALSLAAKPMWITLPFILILLDFWPLQRLDRRSVISRVWEKRALFSLSLLSLVVGGWAAQGSYSSIPTLYNLANAAQSYWIYLGKSLFPPQLAIFYPHGEEGVSLALGVMAALALLLLMLALWRQARQWPGALTGFYWFVGALLPVSGVVQVSFKAMADRFTYMPHLGLFLAMAFVGGRSRLAAFAGVLLLPVWAGITWQQVGVWHSAESLWRQAAAVSPHHFYPRLMVGDALIDAGRFEEAEGEIREAWRLLDHRVHPLVMVKLAEVALLRGDVESAAKRYNTGFGLPVDSPEGLFRLGRRLLRNGHAPQAEKAFREVLARLERQGFPPGVEGLRGETLFHLARIQLRRGEIRAAEEALQQARRLVPDKGRDWCNEVNREGGNTQNTSQIPCNPQ